MNIPLFHFGPYTATDGPRVIYRPSLPDHLLDAAALLVVLATWVAILWVHLSPAGPMGPEGWTAGGGSIVCFLLLGLGSRAPAGCFSFPVRVNAGNIGRQYALAIRTIRVTNVLVCLAVGFSGFVRTFTWSIVAVSLTVVALGAVFVVYLFLALLQRK